MPKPNPTWATIVLMVVVFLKRTYERLFSPRACTGKRSVILLPFPLRHCWLPAPKPGGPRADSPAPPRFQPPPYTSQRARERPQIGEQRLPRPNAEGDVCPTVLYLLFTGPNQIIISEFRPLESSPIANHC